MKKIQTILISASTIASLLISTPAIASRDHGENEDNHTQQKQITANVGINFNSSESDEHAAESEHENAKDAAEAAREAAKDAAEAVRESTKNAIENINESNHESFEHGTVTTASDTIAIDTSTQNVNMAQVTDDDHDDQEHQATVTTDTTSTSSNSFSDLASQISEIRRSLMDAIQNIIDSLFSKTFVITPPSNSTTSTP